MFLEAHALFLAINQTVKKFKYNKTNYKQIWILVIIVDEIFA